MPSSRTLPLLALALFSLSAGPAQALTLKLDYRQHISPADSLRGGPTIHFVNGRSEDHGGDEIFRLGNVRAGAGFPYPVKTKDSHIDQFLTRWVKDCLAAGGWERGDSEEGPQLQITLEDMWIEGYMHYEMSLVLRVDLLRGGKSVWTWRMDEQSGEFLDWTIQELNKPLNAIFEKHSDELTTAFASRDFASAMKGGGKSKAPLSEPDEPARAAPRPSESPPSVSGCSKDTECKGDRVCDAGKCVDP